MKTSNHCDHDIDATVERVSLLLGYLESALRELILHGVQRNEIGNAELEYREVTRQTIVDIDPF